MELAGLTIKVDVDLSNLRTQLGAIQAALNPLNKGMRDFAATTKAVNTAADATAGSVQKLRDRTNETSATTANLGRKIRELTTTVFGSNIAAIAFGTALGNLATQAVSRLLIAFADSVTQFARFHNALTEIDGVAGRAAQSFRLIQNVSLSSNRSLSQLTESYTRLAQQAFGTRVTIDETNQIFREYETRLASIQQKTIGGAISQVLTALGGVIAGLDEVMGISGMIIGAIGLVRDAFNWLREKIGAGPSRPPRSREELGQDLAELENNLALLENRLNSLRSTQGRIFGLTSQQLLIISQIGQARIRERELLREIEGIDLVSADTRQRQVNTMRELQANLAQEVVVGAANVQQQAFLNRMFQITNQLRSVGIDLQDDILLRTGLELQVRRAIAAQQFQGLRRELDPVAVQAEEHAARLANLQIFHDSQLALLRRSLEQQQVTREEFAQREITLAAQIAEIKGQEEARFIAQQMANQQQVASHMINSVMGVVQQLQSVLQLAGQKNKAMAIAAIALSTTLRVVQTIQATHAAIMAVWADPLIPTLQKPAWAAAVGALGAAQVGLIIAGGVLQAGQTAAGPTGAGGGAGGGAQQSEQPGSAPMRIIIEPVDPAAIFTGEQLNRLIGQINTQAENGHVVIASKLIS